MYTSYYENKTQKMEIPYKAFGRGQNMIPMSNAMSVLNIDGSSHYNPFLVVQVDARGRCTFPSADAEASKEDLSLAAPLIHFISRARM